MKDIQELYEQAERKPALCCHICGEPFRFVGRNILCACSEGMGAEWERMQTERINGRCAVVRSLAHAEPNLPLHAHDEEEEGEPLTDQDVQEWERKAACIVGAVVVLAVTLWGIWHGGFGAWVTGK